MTAGEILCLCLVVTRDGSKDGPVFGMSLGDAAGGGEGGAAEQRDGVVKILQALKQEAVMRGAVNVFVKDGVLARMHLRIVWQIPV